MVSDILPGHPIQHLLPGALLGWIEFALATPLTPGGLAILERGWKSIVHRSPNMFLTDCIGTGSAYLKCHAVVARASFLLLSRYVSNLALLRGCSGHYSSGVAGPVLELKARSQNQRGRSRHCCGLAPNRSPHSRRRTTAMSKTNAIQVGDTLRVRPGENRFRRTEL